MKKDLATKTITKCKDVFSDICNVNLLEQELRICPEQLELIPTELTYHDAEGDLREHRMDVRMKYKTLNADIALFCMENQSGISNVMPVRDMGYLYSSYNEQIREIKKENKQAGETYITKEIGDTQKLTPVISLVIYYGLEDWAGPKTLLDMLDISDEWRDKLEPLITNHQIKIVHLAAQDEETRKKYQSDFRHIADYLAYMRNKDKEKLESFSRDKTRKIVHPQEFLDMMHAFSKDEKYLLMAEELQKQENREEEMNMCMLLDIVEERGIAKGKQEEIIHGISVLVETCQELGVSLADTLERVIANFDLTPETAKDEVEKYWR